MTKKHKKNKDVTKEVLKDEEKWYGLEKKFWSVVEFGVYVVLLTFTAVAIGTQYQILQGDKNVIIDEGSKEMSIAGMNDGTIYDIENNCNEEDCEKSFTAQYNGKETDIKYKTTSEGTHLTVGSTRIDSINKIKKIALLGNGFIAIVEDGKENNTTIKYYDTEGNELQTYNTVLEVPDFIASGKGIYGICNKANKELNIIEYEISYDGSFSENTIGIINSSNCQD